MIPSISRHLNIPSLSPIRPPRILHQPIILSILPTIPHDNHRMSKLISGAPRIVVDPTPVPPEITTRIKSDRNRTLSDHHIFQHLFIRSCQISVTSDGDPGHGRSVPTSIVSSLVAVVSVVVDSPVSSDVQVCVRHPTSSAPVRDAIHQLLFAEGHSAPVADPVMSL
jgi:hypothetical protein